MGTSIALVHLSLEGYAARVLAGYGLADLARVSDPKQALYGAFDLGRAGLGQFASPRLWARTAQAVAAGHTPAPPHGADARQMPGVFLIHHGRVVTSFRHETMGDRPDYAALARGGE